MLIECSKVQKLLGTYLYNYTMKTLIHRYTCQVILYNDLVENQQMSEIGFFGK